MNGMTGKWCAVGMFLCASLVGRVAVQAQTATQQERAAADGLFNGSFAVDDKDPEAHIPSPAARDENPLDFGNFLIQLGDKADAAQRRGDKAAAVKYYRALAAAVPEVSTPFAKLCSAYKEAGDADKAERSCEVALTKSGVKPEDFQSYVSLVLAQPRQLRQAEVEKLNTVIEHLKAKQSTHRMAWKLDCQVASRLNDGTRLKSCIDALEQQHVSEADTVEYRWKLAKLRHSDTEAAWFHESAVRLGVSDDVRQRMETATPRAQPRYASQVSSSTKRIVLLGLLSLCLLTIQLLVARRIARSVTEVRTDDRRG